MQCGATHGPAVQGLAKLVLMACTRGNGHPGRHEAVYTIGTHEEPVLRWWTDSGEWSIEVPGRGFVYRRWKAWSDLEYRAGAWHGPEVCRTLREREAPS